ncbi:NAD-dependent epimerase/dehydratase family protein [Aquabacterium sp.]|uniref:NAD-dependent epimerase/dehydratase family protein n=1 Tax=Aquabacterium sp. TaxID=1872578 RepID=UPI002C0E7005|nr:NAD(P)-dependent oxidoreductase [Aquabacterium sp.]HSW06437.1 NAD(P)-dependent oxidoreductase [Aquabacterium sp.]
MKIAVIGATGVAGRAFVAKAQTAGHSLALQRVDVLEPGTLGTLVEGCDALVNLATSIPTPGGRGDWALNDRIRREGTAHVLAACEAAGVRTVLQQSVAMLHCAADDRPQTEDDPIEGYAVLASAFDMEALLCASPLDVRSVRGGFFYGPGTGREERWLEEVRNPAFRMPGDGNAWLTPAHVEDYASALIHILEHGRPHEAYIVCDDTPLRLRELYARAAAQAAVDLPASGDTQWIRSFRTSNTKLRALGWAPAHTPFDRST